MNQYTIAISGTVHTNVYVGATDAMVHKEYRWADTDTVVTYLPWAPGEPASREREDCLGFHLMPDGTFQYHDHWCTDKLNFICERE